MAHSAQDHPRPLAGRGQGVGGVPTRPLLQNDAPRQILNHNQQLNAPLPLPLPREGEGDAVLAPLES
jgi:hypothetical protein